MPLILAVEPDRRQASRIAAVLRTRPRTELVIGESAANALSALAGRVPDVLLTSPLLSRQDEAALAAWLRELGPAAAGVQELTIPILATDAPPAPAQRRGVMSVLRRRETRTTTPDGCEPSMFADQVGLYLDRASAERDALAADAPVQVTAPPEPDAFEAGWDPEPEFAMSFERASFEQASFEEAPLEEVSFETVSLEAASFEAASFEAASFESSVRLQPDQAGAASFEQTSFEQTSFEQTSFEQTPFEQTPFEQTPFEQTLSPAIVEWPVQQVAAPIEEVGAHVEEAVAPIEEISAPAAADLQALTIPIPASPLAAAAPLPARRRNVLSGHRRREIRPTAPAVVLEPVLLQATAPIEEAVAPVEEIAARAADIATLPAEETFEPVTEILERPARIEAPVEEIAASPGRELFAALQDRPDLATRLRGAMSAWGWGRQPSPVESIATAVSPLLLEPVAAEESPAGLVALGVVEEIAEPAAAVTAPDTERLWRAVPLEEIVDTVIAFPKPDEVAPAGNGEWILTPIEIPEMHERFAAPAPPAAPIVVARATPAAEPPTSRRPATKRRTSRSKAKPKPVQDEWGFFDPEQCGFAALLAKLDEITEEDDEDQNRAESTVQIVAY